ncbi:hypothetical protein [Luteipulveratus flavus]|uniref:1,4-alpha-glucan branching enzyme n=1 Tax=Luteipulveratus flavus TaxID=3031728 RepID=A0ABT6C7D8_9MICO|nr:hypothetical protein [Luteipulveratus sp. YIM 133296]MDF8264856.1 hypothetical protein [Luteipulveratus sp. YIM 133296]
MASQRSTTTDHDEIRAWVEKHDGRPAAVKYTATGDDPGVLRIGFPGGMGPDVIEQITWDQWFGKFEDEGLAFCYPRRQGEEDSTSFRLVER